LNNSTGFSALPGGNCSGSGGTFNGVGYNGYWWSSTEGNTFYAWYRIMVYDYSTVDRGYASKQSGFSVRCVRDSQ
jgi:uncharacterized protein (TIGR02145 family)